MSKATITTVEITPERYSQVKVKENDDNSVEMSCDGFVLRGQILRKIVLRPHGKDIYIVLPTYVNKNYDCPVGLYVRMLTTLNTPIDKGERFQVDGVKHRKILRVTKPSDVIIDVDNMYIEGVVDRRIYKDDIQELCFIGVRVLTYKAKPMCQIKIKMVELCPDEYNRMKVVEHDDDTIEMSCGGFLLRGHLLRKYQPAPLKSIRYQIKPTGLVKPSDNPVRLYAVVELPLNAPVGKTERFIVNTTRRRKFSLINKASYVIISADDLHISGVVGDSICKDGTQELDFIVVHTLFYKHYSI